MIYEECKMLDVEKIREDFPILSRPVYGRPLVYLDSAATAQKPRRVIDCERRLYEEANANVHRGVHYLSGQMTELFEEARERVRSFIEHHSNIVPWQLVCGRRGVEMRVLPFDDTGRLMVERLPELLDGRTKLVAVTQASNVLGTMPQLDEVVSAAHAVGAVVLVDGCQGIVHGGGVPRSPTCRSSSRPERPIMSVPSVSAKRWNISGKSAWTESRSTNIAWRSMPPTDCPPWRGCVSTVRRRISAASFHSMRKGCMLTIWE